MVQGTVVNKLKELLKKETVLCAAVLLGIVSSFFYAPQADYIDWEVLSVLLALMLVVAGLKSVYFLDWAAVELLNGCTGSRQMVLALVGITYISSMFVTNDVALITFVPLALIAGRRLKMDVGRVIILQTLAANLGSMMTPPGNPQNLFLYSRYGYEALEFFKVMALPGLFSVIFLLLLIFRGRSTELRMELEQRSSPPRLLTGVYLALLALNIAAVLHAVDKTAALAVTAAAVLAFNRRLFLRVDYSLLVTFIGFFVFIGNISHAEFVHMLQDSALGGKAGTYLTAAAASQFISNVPAAMLLAGMTKEADALLLGVNIGGLGTLIASMASVISYKLFAAEHPYQAGSYLRMFFFYNFAGLLLIGGLTYLYLIYW